MINDIVEQMWDYDCKVNLSLAKLWIEDYIKSLGDLMGIDYSNGFSQYLRDQGRLKMWELYDFVQRNYKTNPDIKINLTKMLMTIPAHEVAKVEYETGKYRFER